MVTREIQKALTLKRYRRFDEERKRVRKNKKTRDTGKKEYRKRGKGGIRSKKARSSEEGEGRRKSSSRKVSAW